jgi:class 3 adenylate cyclase/predicted ATPase
MKDDPYLSFDQIRTYLPPHLSQRLSAAIEPDKALEISQHIRSVRHSLSTYLPRYLLRSIQEDPTPGKVSGFFRQGAVLFADVSGFTAMSRTLSALGKEGAEEITGIVNNYFSSMLEISDRFGGDLLKFGGDALLIYFDGHSGPLFSLAAGNAMQSAMERFVSLQTSQGVFPLQMKIGVACGPTFMANLGTPEVMDYAVLGNTLTEVAQAEGLAQPGQIVVSARIRQVVDQFCEFEPLERGFWRLQSLKLPPNLLNELTRSPSGFPQFSENEPSPQIEACLRDVEIIAGMKPYVPDELLSWIVADPTRLSLYSSHRPVTVMFANFYGIDDFIAGMGQTHPDVITQTLNSHFVVMNDVNIQYGGTINRLDAYTKGNRFLILFGALRAHEDDPQRAVRTALEMNRRLGEVNRQTADRINEIPELKGIENILQLRQRIGINSGFVFAGNTGSATRREYTVMGDQVNLTARLMGISQDDEVLIGQSTARQLGEDFTLWEKEPVKVKGIQDPVRNFLVKGVRDAARMTAVKGSGLIAGRERELELGKNLVDEAIRGKGGVLILRGVSGIGKTRLAEEIAQYAEMKNMELLFGTCLSYGRTMTYHPWAELLRTYFDIQTAEPPQDISSRVEAVRRGMDAIQEGMWTPLIGAILGLEIPDNDLTRDMNPQLRRQRVRDLMLRLLMVRSMSKPLIIIIEDSHWADPASVDLIDYIGRNIPDQPVVLILPQRPDPGLPDWSAHSHASILDLGDLSLEASREIVVHYLGGAPLPEAVYQAVLTKGGGNPFFILEVVRALIDSGVLRQDQGDGWQVSRGLSALDLPDTIHGVILSRFDRLIAVHRRILQVASVIGRIFDYLTLDGVYPYSDISRSLHHHLSALNELGLTEHQSAEMEIYRFIHLTTQEVVYGSLSFEHRRLLHRGIGDFIESTSIESLSEQNDLLAYHYFEGHAWLKAVEYNLAAARHAQREFANETAILSGLQALEAATNLGSDVDTRLERFAAHEILIEVLTLLGRYDQALEHCNQAQEILEIQPFLPDRARMMAEICRKIAAVHERQSDYSHAFEWLRQGLTYLDDEQATIEAVRIYLLGTGIYRRLGENDRAANWCQRSIQIASQIESRQGQQAIGQAYYNLGGIENRRGDLQNSVAYCRKSLEIYQQIDDIVGQARAYTNLGVSYSDLGYWEQAMDAYNSSLAINQKIGDIQSQGFLENNLANIHLNRGELDRAANLFQQSNEIWKRIGSPLPDAVTLSNLAQVYIYQQNWTEARACLKQSQVIFEEIGSDVYIPELERRWGELLLNLGDLDHAKEHLERSISIATGQESHLELGMSLRVLGEIQLAKNDFEASRDSLDSSLAILKDRNSDYEAAKTILVLTRLRIQLGKEVDRDQFREAVEAFRRLNAQRDLAEAMRLSDLQTPSLW